MHPRPTVRMPVSLLWLPDDLYWKQDLSGRQKAAVPEDAPALPFRHVPEFATRSR